MKVSLNESTSYAEKLFYKNHLKSFLEQNGIEMKYF